MENESYYEEQLRIVNALEKLEEKREHIKRIDFTKLIQKEGDARIISELNMFKELPLKEKKVNEGIVNKEIKAKIDEFFDKRDLAKKVIAIQPFYYDENHIWHYWDKTRTCWKMIDETDILNIIGNISSQNTINSKEKGEILEALRQESRMKKPKEMGKLWVQFKDEIFDLQTGNKFKATPEWFAVNPIPWRLNEDNFINTEKMDEIFEQWVGKDYVKTLYEIIAYCMLADYPIHRLFCLIGEGLNGKSCFLNLLKKFIGSDNCSSTELDLLLSSRFEASRKLYKKSVCIMGETNFTELSKTSILKKATGQDTMGFEYKNKTPFDDVNYAKIIIATNNLPETIDKTIGFYRRWMIIDFPNQFNEKIDILATIPEEEYGCLALKCCGILRDLLNAREFTNEGSVEQRMKRYEDKSDFLQKFLEDNVSDSFDCHITKKEFQKKFDEWCYENKHRKMAENTLGRKMKIKGYEAKQVQASWMNDGRGGLMRVWDGIKWVE